MISRKFVAGFASIALSASLLAGCGTTSPTNASTTGAAATQASADYGTVTIENGDRTITFTEMPQRVISTNLYNTENMVMLGLGDKLVGRNEPQSDAEKPLDEIADEVNAIPTLKKSNESVVEAQADLVIGQISSFKDDAWGSFDKLSGEGVNGYAATGTLVSDETVDDIYTDLTNLGKIFKVEAKANELIEQMKGRVQAVQDKVSGISEDQKPKVFVMDSFKDNQIYTTSSGLQSNLIELAGGINTTKGKADSRWFTTSVETLVDANPDIIIFNDYGKQTIQEKMDFINNNPALENIPAVKNQNYLTIRLTDVMQDVRAATACETFAKFFYPDLFQG